MTSTATTQSTPFRFYDNRQKYLAFVHTCNEKAVIAARCSEEIARLRPAPPALRIFDAGMGDGTVLARMMRSAHSFFPNVPQLAVAKEISLEDVRLGLDKMPERFFEHPATVLVITNLTYVDAPGLMPADPKRVQQLNWQEVRLAGNASHDFSEQIEALAPMLAHGWETRPSETTGNPVPTYPTVLVMYRQDHEFILNRVIPRPGRDIGGYDFALASQPWRARVDAKFKAEKILAPLARTLRPGGRLLTVQSWGRDPAAEIVEQIWPGEVTFSVDRHALLDALREELGPETESFDLTDPPDADAVLRYKMHTLPTEIGDRIGTSTLFAAWNAVIYVNQIEDERVEEAIRGASYLNVTQDVLHKYGELWFNDEAFVVERLA